MSPLYRSNPFYLLGMRATASARDVRRRIEELDVQITLGSPVNGLDSDAMRRIRQTLESPSDRLRAELFWLHSDSADRVLDLSDVATVTGEVRRLQSLWPDVQGTARAMVTHDLAVLRHASWLEAQRDSVAATANHSQLRPALAAWEESLSSPDLVRYVETRRATVVAPPIDIAAVASGEVLRTVAAVASAALDQRRSAEAASLVSLIRSSGLGSQAIDDSVNEATKNLRGEIARALTALMAARDADQPPEKAVRTEWELLVTGVLASFRRFELIDETSVDDALRDRVAVAARLVSVDVWNKLENAQVACGILEFALRIAKSESTLSQIASDNATVRYQHHSAAAVVAFDAGSVALAAAHAELGEQYAPSAESQVQIRALANAARARALDYGVAMAKTSIVEEFGELAQHFAADTEKAARFESVSYAPPRAKPAVRPEETRAPAPTNAGGKWLAAGVAVLVLFAWANARPASSRPAPTATFTVPSPRTSTPSPVASTPTATPQSRTATPAANAPRAVNLRPDQMIIPEAEFTIAGYTASSDVACGVGCFQRTFTALDINRTGNYFFSVMLIVGNLGTAGTSLVAQQDCLLVDPGGSKVSSHEIGAQVVGEAAKACRHDVGTAGDTTAYSYFTANRNVLIRIRSNPYFFGTTDAQATSALVTLARLQLSIIDRVAPR